MLRAIKRTIHNKVLLGGGLTLVAGVLLAGGNWAAAATDSCTNPATTYGTDTVSMNIPSAGTYYIWTRMQIPDSADNSFLLKIDGTSCYNVGGSSSLPIGSWQWVNYNDGSGSNVISLSLTAGNHTLTLVGTDPSVEVDRILALTDSSCVPTGTGSNCTTSSGSPPTVTFSSPANGAAIKGTVAVSPTVTANGGNSISQVQLLFNSATVQTLTSTPYSFSLNTLSYKDGTYTLAVEATDNQSLTGSQSVSVGISNGDLNSDNKISVSDLAVMAGNWDKTSATYAQGDINGDGKVNISDLSILANNWGKSW